MNTDYLKNKRILLVDDEPELQNMVTSILRNAGFTCLRTAGTVRDAVNTAREFKPELAILDVMLPDGDGFSLMEQLKSGSDYPILFLTARGEDEDKFRGFGLGADDYMVKPFVFKELLARIKVMTRRKPEIQENIYRCGDLVIDYNTHEVTRSQIPISLSPKEFAVLLYLVRNKNIIVTREQIESNIWKLQSEVSSNLVDVYIRYLRRKIDDDFDEKMICTIRGTGYMLKCEE